MDSNRDFKGKLSEESVRKAVKALTKWRKINPKSDKSFDEEEAQSDDDSNVNGGFLYLVLTLKKNPPKDLCKTPHNILLPHSLNSSDLNLCLIIDDRPIKSSNRITSEAAQKRIKAEEIPMTKVLKLSKLKSEYNSFESRRNLYNYFDLFLADKRVVPLLPKLLGKQFYRKKRKVPVPLDLKHSSSWKEQIERACDTSLLCLGGGTCSVLRVAKCGLDSEMRCDEIVENVFAAIKGILEVVPKKWVGIRALHLKLSDSLALPIYEAFSVSRLNIGGEVQGSGLRRGQDSNLEDKQMKKLGNNDGSLVDGFGENDGDRCENGELDRSETMEGKRIKEEYGYK